jgi:alpha-L-arabinofuranosidase
MMEMMTRSPAAWPLEHRARKADPNIVFLAAWDKDKASLILQVLNFGKESVQASFDVKALGFAPRRAKIAVLWADSLQARNTLADPGAVRSEERTASFGETAHFNADLKPCSMTLITLLSR